MANKHQAHSLKVVTVGHPATPHTFSRRAYHECLILQIVFTPYCLCTTEKYGEPHRNSSLEITLTSSSWIKGAQCNLGSSTCGIWQQRMSNSAWCRNWAGLYSWISWYILHHASKNTNKQFAYPKAFRSISTLHRAHKSWFLCSFSLSCKVRCKWLNVKQRNLSTGPKLHSPHLTLYSAFLLRSFVKHQHRYKPSPMTTNIKDWCTKTGLASF